MPSQQGLGKDLMSLELQQVTSTEAASQDQNQLLTTEVSLQLKLIP